MGEIVQTTQESYEQNQDVWKTVTNHWSSQFLETQNMKGPNVFTNPGNDDYKNKRKVIGKVYRYLKQIKEKVPGLNLSVFHRPGYKDSELFDFKFSIFSVYE